MDGMHPINVRIPSYFISRDGRKHIEFVLDVEAKKPPTSKLLQHWTVHRRYNQFVKLHEKLKKRFPRVTLPELPPKKVVRSMDPNYLENKKKLLEVYLQTLVALQDVSTCEDFTEFLEWSRRDFSLRDTDDMSMNGSILVPDEEDEECDHKAELEKACQRIRELEFELDATMREKTDIHRSLASAHSQLSDVRGQKKLLVREVKRLRTVLEEIAGHALANDFQSVRAVVDSLTCDEPSEEPVE
eukprot:GILJ01002095.1.p1 GENE.GILJ01002095.1~~GILJ01002095.1.p1  ORF type:complete len:258 (+),score=47.10 GILJ01002095.1:48-776(+)